MGQEEIIKVLEKSDIPLSARQIAEALDDNFSKVCSLINKLMNSNDIFPLDVSYDKALQYFGSTRRLRVYYIRKLTKKEIKSLKNKAPFL